MPHQIAGRKLGRKTGPRMALYRNMIVSVLRYEQIKTTEARAAYALALSHLDVAAPQRKLVELKLSQVGGVPAKPEASS